MFKNVFLMFTLFIFTIVSLLIINFNISSGFLILEDLEFLHIILFIILPLILNIYLIFVLIKGIYKNQLSKNYGFGYLGFILLIIIYYFTIFTNTPDYKFIPESEFETKLQNIKVDDEKNGLVKLDKFARKNKEFVKEISHINNEGFNMYSCFSEGKHCENIDKKLVLKKYFDFIDNNKAQIEKLNFELEEINKLEYFKENLGKEEYTSLQGFSELTRFSLFQSIYYLEKGNTEKALKILNIYSNLGNNFFTGDNTIIGMIVGITIKNVSIQNYKYIIENYDINKSSSEFKKFESDLNIVYDSKEIFGNAIKIEYQSNTRGFNIYLHNSMLINKKEFFNIQRNRWEKIINGEKGIYDNKIPSKFKREIIYFYLMGGTSNNFLGYKEEIEKLNDIKLKLKELIK